MSVELLEEEKAEKALKQPEDLTPAQVYALLREQFKYLAELRIGRQDAAEKYGIPAGTIQRWGKNGWVRTLQKAMGQGRQVIVNEQDVAVMLEMNRRFRTRSSGPIKGWRPPKLV